MNRIEINLFKYCGYLQNSDAKWIVPEWAVDCFIEGDIYYRAVEGVSPSELFVKTSRGDKMCEVGNYIAVTDGSLSILGVI